MELFVFVSQRQRRTARSTKPPNKPEFMCVLLSVHVFDAIAHICCRCCPETVCAASAANRPPHQEINKSRTHPHPLRVLQEWAVHRFQYPFYPCLACYVYQPRAARRFRSSTDLHCDSTLLWFVRLPIPASLLTDFATSYALPYIRGRLTASGVFGSTEN